MWALPYRHTAHQECAGKNTNMNIYVNGNFWNNRYILGGQQNNVKALWLFNLNGLYLSLCVIYSDFQCFQRNKLLHILDIQHTVPNVKTLILNAMLNAGLFIQYIVYSGKIILSFTVKLIYSGADVITWNGTIIESFTTMNILIISLISKSCRE